MQILQYSCTFRLSHNLFKKFNSPKFTVFYSQTGNSPFHFAVRRCWINFCKILIDLGTDINLPNKKGVTSLMMAASKGYDSMVFSLLQHKADAFVEDQVLKLKLFFFDSKNYRIVALKRFDLLFLERMYGSLLCHIETVAEKSGHFKPNSN